MSTLLLCGFRAVGWVEFLPLFPLCARWGESEMTRNLGLEVLIRSGRLVVSTLLLLCNSRCCRWVHPPLQSSGIERIVS